METPRLFATTSALLSGLLLITGCGADPDQSDIAARSERAIELSVVPNADAYISGCNPGTNYGSATSLQLGGSNCQYQHVLVRFAQGDIQTTLGQQVLLQAQLEFTVAAVPTNPQSAKVYRMTSTWDESTVNYWSPWWSWTASGESGRYSFQPAPSVGTRVRVDVTGDVQSYLAGTASNFGWLINGADTTGTGYGPLQFGSRESVNPPRLVLSVLDNAHTPSVQAPVLDRTVANDTCQRISFLYTQAPYVQWAVNPAAIDCTQIALLRGKIIDASNSQPLPGVTVSILSRPEFGQTRTRNSTSPVDDRGEFDMAVHAGPLTVVYTKPGYVPVQRAIDVVANETAWVPDVAMTPFAAPALVNGSTGTNLQPNFSQWQYAEAAAVGNSGAIGTTWRDRIRHSVVLIPPSSSPRVFRTEADFQSNTFTTLTAPYQLSLTDVTTQPTTGADTMPASLPPSSAFTYAVEASIPQARDAAGAEPYRIDFGASKPVTYVENFVTDAQGDRLPVGTDVPTGSYDRARGAWIPGPNGKIVQLVRTPTLGFNLDATPGIDPSQYAALGITTAEISAVANLKDPATGATVADGAQFWRVPVPYFSGGVFDHNYAFQQIGEFLDRPIVDVLGIRDQVCSETGSIIGCENQSLGEQVEITGTPFALSYTTTRVPGRRDAYVLEIPLTKPAWTWADTAGLLRIRVEASVAGKRLGQAEWTPLIPLGPDQTLLTANAVQRWEWDGKDNYGRLVQGEQAVTVRIVEYYDSEYVAPSGFGGRGGNGTGVSVRRELPRELVIRGTIGQWDETATGLGGWRVSAHHAYDASSRALLYGDGSTRRVGTTGTFVRGLPATGSPTIRDAYGIARDLDGTLLVVEHQAAMDGKRIYRVWPPTNSATLPAPQAVAGNGSVVNAAALGDIGVCSDQSGLLDPYDVAVGSDGTAYVLDHGTPVRVWALRRDATCSSTKLRISLYAGGGSVLSGATTANQASFVNSQGIAVGPDGTLYVADTGNNKVRTVSPAPTQGERQVRDVATVGQPLDVAVTPSGLIFVGTNTTGNKIVRIENGGSTPVITNIVPPTGLTLGAMGALVATADNGIYAAEVGPGSRKVFRVEPGATRASLYLGTTSGPAGTLSQVEGQAPLDCAISGMHGLAVGTDSNLYVTTNFTTKFSVYRVESSLPGVVVGENAVADADGSAYHVFDSRGRHLRTHHGITQAALLTFGYDPQGRLSSITGPEATWLTVQRDSAGVPLSLTSRHGRVTTLGFTAGATPCVPGSACRMLGTIAPPVSGTSTGAYTLTYPVSATNPGGGVLGTFATPLGNTSSFTYQVASGAPGLPAANDGARKVGRLVRDTGPAVQDANPIGGGAARPGGYSDIARTDSFLVTDALFLSSTATITSALGRNTGYFSYREADGSPAASFYTTPEGAVTSVAPEASAAGVASDGRRVTTPGGTLTTMRRGTDPRYPTARFGNFMQTQRPNGLVMTTRVFRRYDAPNRTERVIINATPDAGYSSGSWPATDPAAWETVINETARTITTRTPGGRTQTISFDTLGRVTQSAAPGTPTTINTYYPSGASIGYLQRTATGSTGQRWAEFNYWNGNLTYPRLPVDNDVSLAQYYYDARDRFYYSYYPLPPEYYAWMQLGYDSDDRIVSVTPWLSSEYEPTSWSTTHTSTGAANVSTTPTTAQTANYDYDREGRFEAVQLPSGRLVDAVYESSPRGRLRSMVVGSADGSAPKTFSYLYDDDAAIGGLQPWQLRRIDSPYGPTQLTLGYDAAGMSSGDTLTSVAWSGAAVGSMTYAFDTRFRAYQYTLAAGGQSFVSAVGFDAAAPTATAFNGDGLQTLARLTPPMSAAVELSISREAAPAPGRVTSTALGTLTTTQTYDPDGGELKVLTAAYGTTEYHRIDAVTRDGGGRITRRQETVRLPSGAGTLEDRTFTYNNRGRLTQVNVTGGAYLELYSYYPNGEREAVAYNGGGWQYVSHGAAGQITAQGQWNYGYNTDGQRINRVTGGGNFSNGYRYDASGNLTGVSSEDYSDSYFGEVTYAIDGLGRRVSRTTSGSSWGGEPMRGPATEKYLYLDGLRVVATLDASNQPVSVFEYATRGNVPDFFVQKSGANWVTYRILSDERGSPVLVVRVSDGKVMERTRYLAYGFPVASSFYRCTSDGSCPDYTRIPFGFAGGLIDDETGLLHFGARDYDPETGQWLTRDPIGFEGGLNQYEYVYGDPINFVDPSGLFGDAAWDAVSLGIDIATILEKGCGSTVGDWLALVVDAIALAIPMVPAVGASMHATVTMNRLNGLRQERNIAKALHGYEVMRNVTVTTPLGRRVLDIVYRTKGSTGAWRSIESKRGIFARLSSRQRHIDSYINAGGSITNSGVGKFLGQSVEEVNVVHLIPGDRLYR